jgi:hypothetical protein
MTAKVVVTGLNQVRTNLRRVRSRQRRAEAAALRRTANTIRGRVRRAIAALEAIPLKLTRKRVQWFWKSRREARGEVKMWMGTRYPITAAELPRLRKAPKGEKKISLAGDAAAQFEPLVARTFRERYRIELRSQLRRFGL